MSAARRARRAGRNLLIALLVGALIIVAIVVAYVAGRSNTTHSAEPSDKPSSSQPRSTAETDAAPTGCLGGPTRDNLMVTSAQRSAQHTVYGAVEVATAFFRWSYRYPHPSPGDVSEVRGVFVPAASDGAQQQLIADYERNPNPSNGEVSDGTSFYLTSVGGRWLVGEASNEQEPRISVLMPLVVDGAVSPTKTTSEAFDLRWVAGAWRVAGVAQASPESLVAGGTAFTSGC